MDERAEATKELRDLQRDEAADAAERRAEREYWQEAGLAPHELTMLEAERWSR